MTPHLTGPNPELDRMIRQTPAGMMFWSGSNNSSSTCSGCKYFGFSIVERDSAGNAINTKKCPDRCELYWKYTGKVSKPFPGSTLACKYYEAKA